MSDEDTPASPRLPDEYPPFVIGTGEIRTELSISDPAHYSVGFEDQVTLEEAVGLVPEGWEPASLAPIRDDAPAYQHTFSSTVPVLSPNELQELLAGPSIRYIVPAYQSPDYGAMVFTPVPNHVIVLGRDTDEGVLAEVDRRAESQGFFPIDYRGFEVDGLTRRVYSSLVSEREPPSERRERYVGEPGPALFLIEDLMNDMGGDSFSAEPDWFVTSVNELGTLATRQASTRGQAQRTTFSQASTDMGAARVAILDGEFDLNFTNGRLPFSPTRFNAIRHNQEVGVEKDHAHGTLCAGLIGAQKPIPGWDEAGVAPGGQMIPVSIYEIADPIQAELGHLVDGIRFAVDNGCTVISISVAGYLPGSDLTTIVEWADRRNVLLVSGTGNLILEESAAPADFVLYPAAYRTVLGVGAAVVESGNAGPILRRVQPGMFAANEIEWESRFGEGIDVVAPGLGVTSTDISGTAGASPTDTWDSFSGTSASTPLVAGFAAKIVSTTGFPPAQVRDEIRRSARRMPPHFNVLSHDPQWVREVGAGLVSREVIDAWQPSASGVDETDPKKEDEDMPETAGAVSCGAGRQITDVRQEMGLDEELENMFKDSLRPLGDFLIALGSSEGNCSVLATEFWRDPYRIARIVGVPWHAAVLLGQGNWEAVYEAVDAENHRNRSNNAGPIWVRVS